MATNYNMTDMFKNMIDFKQPLETCRGNLEAVSQAGQSLTETAQEIFRRSTELSRANGENMLRASKELFSTGTPESNIAKQADFARAMFENTLSNFREVTEMMTKSSFEAFDILNRRAAESLEEISNISTRTSASKAKKAA